MIIDLSGKTALVTGSTSGIGFAIAKGLLIAGADVVICGRDPERLNKALDELAALNTQSSVRGYSQDLSKPDECARLINKLPEADILINNLGIYEAGDFFSLEDEAWEHMFQVNVMSGIRLSRHYARGMKQKGWGRIQFISSESAVNIPADMVHYGVSKSALQGVSRGLAKTLAGTGVTVNSILPGPTLTEGAAEFINGMAKERGVSLEEMQTLFLQENRPSTLTWRFSSPEEVANMCVYVASDQASATTGAALRVEGGIVESVL